MRRRIAPFLAVFFGVALVAAELIKLPYIWEGPGSVHDVVPLIEVSGHATYPTDDKLLLTTVSISADRLTALQLLAVWLDPQKAAVPESHLLSPGQTMQQENELERYAMDGSQLDATLVALTKIGDYPKEHAPGALVEATAPGCDADGKLFSGNVITSINGQDISDIRQASKIIDSTPPGEPISFVAKAGSKDVTVTLTRTPCGSDGENYVGVVLVNNFPYRVDIANAGIGGPSAGLMFALGLYDLLTPGDLTDGRTIAGTGEIWSDGTVHPIGGVEKKVYAAAGAGAALFLVPKENYQEALKAGADIKIVPVASFDEALAALNGDTGAETEKGS